MIRTMVLLGIGLLAGCAPHPPPDPTVPAADAPVWHLNVEPSDDSNGPPMVPAPSWPGHG